MDKQKEIEKIVKAIQSAAKVSAEYFRNELNKAMASGEKHLNRCDGRLKSIYEFEAEALINAGYGDVKQAVREFAEEFEKELYEIMTPVDDTDELDLDSDKVKDLLKKLVKEVCGE